MVSGPCVADNVMRVIKGRGVMISATVIRHTPLVNLCTHKVIPLLYKFMAFSTISVIAVLVPALTFIIPDTSASQVSFKSLIALYSTLQLYLCITLQVVKKIHQITNQLRHCSKFSWFSQSSKLISRSQCAGYHTTY